MAVTIIKSPNKYSFVGNSIAFELQTDSSDFVKMEIKVGENTYSATYYSYNTGDNQFVIHADISDYLKIETEIVIPEDEIITPISHFNLPYQVDIFDEENNLVSQFIGIAFQGGIPNSSFRTLYENEMDIFKYRLASFSEQFLFTTRTNGKEIKVKETELFPFIFISLGMSIVFQSETGDQIASPAQPAGSICAMDIKKVLSQMPEGTKQIDIMINGKSSFSFKILPGKLSEERYLLKFKNSLGAFEILEVTGRAMHAPEFSDESLWETINDLNFYEERRERVKSKGIIEVETGYKERREFPFILDLIKSDEIYFIYPDGESFRCHVKADNAQFRHLMTEPTSINLKIREVIDEEFINPDKFKFLILPPNYIELKVDSSINQIFSFASPKNITFIDWGDGTIEEVSPASGSLVSHTFSENNVFNVKIYTDSSEILTINFLGQAALPVSDSRKMLKTIDFNHSNISGFGDYIFTQCTNLAKIYASNKITKIGVQAFAYCSAINLFSVDLSNVIFIGYAAFYGAFASGSAQSLNFSNPNVVFDPQKPQSYVGFFESSKVGSVTINHDSIANKNNYTVPQNFIKNTSEITLISLGEVHDIGGSAFNSTPALTTFDVDVTKVSQVGNLAFNTSFASGSHVSLTFSNDSLTFVGADCFKNSNVWKLVINPNVVLNMPNGFICGCKNLVTLHVGKVTSIGMNAMSDLNSLSDFIIDLSNCTYLGPASFINSFPTDSGITLDFSNPNLTWYQGYMYGIFQNCGAQKIKLPSASTETLENNMFSNVRAREINLNSPTNIGTSNLLSTTLNILRVFATVPPVLAGTPISIPNIQQIHIPVGTKSAYESATYWTQWQGKFIDDL